MGDLLGFPKGTIVNLVVRKVKKMVPAFSLPGAVKFKDALAAGRAHDAQRRRRSGPTTSPSCSTPAAPPACPRARRCCTATSSPTCCRTRHGCSRPCEGRAHRADHHRHGAAAVPHLRAHRVLPARHAHRRLSLLIPNPRDIPAFDQGARKYRFNMLPGGEHALQRAAQPPRLRQARLLEPAQVCQRRRHGGAAGGRRALVQGSPAARSSRAMACPRPRRSLPATRCDISEYTGTIGLPMPSTEISIRDDDGNEAAARPAGRDLHRAARR